ncbi:MAG: glycoside hydrolase family 97 catalytic domain-containing protein [Bryobacterales bacterium]|nr:glycoside hydrolase family 97 catalytic domain-containing protein [Bryobacterales bacterium]
MRSLVWIMVLAAMGWAETVESPGRAVRLEVNVVEGRVLYGVSFGGKEVIRPSALGLGLEGAARLDSHFRVVRTDRASHRLNWKPAYGERAEIPDHYQGLTLELEETIAPQRRLTVEFRAYDEGVAFRYRLGGLRTVTVGDEVTEFRLAPGASVWETPGAQREYRRVVVDRMSGASERPLLVELPNGLWAAVGEAGVEDYPNIHLAPLRSERHSLGVQMLGPARLPAGGGATPWRVVLVGARPGDLLEHNYLFENLSPPSRVIGTSWIRPGKVLREVTLSTRGGREAVDFAVANGIRYIEYDAGWYGHEYHEASDATRVNVDPLRLNKDEAYRGLELREVIHYARSKGVGVILYVNRRALERQLDEILPLFASWGVAGVKYGFVNVYGQGWNRWLYQAVEKAAAHRLVLDVHDNFRPTGMSRTYPNLLTQEGILGNEGFPDADHSTILPFTRMLAGAADYTFCWLDARLKNTWAHQLAMTVVIYSPLQFVYWYDRPVAFGSGDWPGMTWFREVPTTWDDTRVLGGAPGQYAAVARRSGDDWFIGVVANNAGGEQALRLDMLDAGREYDAQLYLDGDGPKDIRVETRRLRRGEEVRLQLLPRGGAAIRLRRLAPSQ